jgi:cardiolipin synthase A/B
MLTTIAIVVAGILAAILMVTGFSFLVRTTPVGRVRTLGSEPPDSYDDPVFARMMGLHSTVHLSAGNTVEAFQNGDETYPQLWEDLKNAKESITLQMYYCKPGVMAERLAGILCERAAAGVKILFLHDAFGSQALPDEYHDKLRKAGVTVKAFRPTHWYQLHKAQHRSHIRVVVIDGVLGWTGGFGIDDKWFGGGRKMDEWREINARFTGPAVLQHQACFMAGWAEATGELITGSPFFPDDPPPEEGGIIAGSLYAAPSVGSTTAERFLALTIASVKKRLYIWNAYFVPLDNFQDLLIEAARRGVDVRVITASSTTDTKVTWLAGRARYETLLEGGVRMYEYRPSMLHAKSIVADGCWCVFGTLNLDNRSLALNDESVLMALDPELGKKCEKVFADDLEHCYEIKLDEFRKRPLYMKMAEQACTTISPLL